MEGRKGGREGGNVLALRSLERWEYLGASAAGQSFSLAQTEGLYRFRWVFMEKNSHPIFWKEI